MGSPWGGHRRHTRGMTSEADLPRQPVIDRSHAASQSEPPDGLSDAHPSAPSPMRTLHLPKLWFCALPPTRLAIPSVGPLCPLPLTLTRSPLPSAAHQCPHPGRAPLVTCSRTRAGRPSRRRGGRALGQAASGCGGRGRRRHHHGQPFPCAGTTDKRGHPVSDHKLLRRSAETKVP